MSDWAQASWWAGGAMGVAALIVMLLALFRDRSRERFAAHVESWFDNGTTAPQWPVHRARRVRIEGRGLAWHVDDELKPEPPPDRGPVRVDGTVVVELTGAVPLAV